MSRKTKEQILVENLKIKILPKVTLKYIKNQWTDFEDGWGTLDRYIEDKKIYPNIQQIRELEELVAYIRQFSKHTLKWLAAIEEEAVLHEAEEINKVVRSS